MPDAPLAIDAATINVNTTNDEFNTDGDCSLREAIESANQDKAYSGCTAGSGVNDQVIVPAGIYMLTLPTSLRVTETPSSAAQARARQAPSWMRITTKPHS